VKMQFFSIRQSKFFKTISAHTESTRALIKFSTPIFSSTRQPKNFKTNSVEMVPYPTNIIFYTYKNKIPLMTRSL
jgi:hypothetical protein